MLVGNNGHGATEVVHLDFGGIGTMSCLLDFNLGDARRKFVMVQCHQCQNMCTLL